jgi:hypothetical protein
MGEEFPGDGYMDPLAAPRARYDEPPAPPFDYWQPTWMPCQSLRTNRSLVLGHLYVGMDIMGWATKGVHAPALVTTSPAGTTAGAAGVLGTGNTTVLFGSDTLHSEMRPGGQLRIGWWLDPNQYSGIEWHYLEIDGHDLAFHAGDNVGSGIVARPILNAGTGLNDSVLVNFPGQTSGAIDVTSVTQFTSTGILYRRLFWSSPYARADWLAGYRHTHLYDRLRVDESLRATVTAGGIAAGSTLTRLDQFQAINQFDGADLGLRGWWSNNGKIAVTSLAKIGLGASNNTVLVNGSTAIRSGGTTTTTAGGVLALPSNMGRFSQQEFSVLSELGLGLEWQPACFWKFSLGYTWFYWSDVSRAISQVNTTVARNQLAPTAGAGTFPAFQMQTTSFWAQGLTAGFTYQF